MSEALNDLAGWAQGPLVLLVLSAVALGALLLALLWGLIYPDTTERRVRGIMQNRPLAEERGRPPTTKSRLPQLDRRIEAFGKRFNWNPEHQRLLLRRAGYPQRDAYVVVLMFKAVAPLLALPLAWLYLDLILGDAWHGLLVFLASLLLAIAAFWAPDLYVRNMILRRRERIRRTWPYALDLIQLCVNAGMGLEPALAKVARETRVLAPDISDELNLTVSELMYLQNRRAALERLAHRVDMAPVREAIMVFIQSERYGMALGDTLQGLAEESRRQRLVEAEKKAASLPPKLTVPMILFFLPALFVVILSPALIRVFELP
ncbi:MAG: type II secretion system F family protein [Pararhodobacter sp.]|nr:type II secretion system F family protein [Pararhodobacter sp.]